MVIWCHSIQYVIVVHLRKHITSVDWENPSMKQLYIAGGREHFQFLLEKGWKPFIQRLYSNKNLSSTDHKLSSTVYVSTCRCPFSIHIDGRKIQLLLSS